MIIILGLLGLEVGKKHIRPSLLEFRFYLSCLIVRAKENISYGEQVVLPRWQHNQLDNGIVQLYSPIIPPTSLVYPSTFLYYTVATINIALLRQCQVA